MTTPDDDDTGLMTTPVHALGCVMTWAILAGLSHAVPVGFTTRGGSSGACRVFSSRTPSTRRCRLGREALVSPDQGQQRLVDVLKDGACSAL